MDQRWGHMKINFDYFQIQKWILQINRVEKVDEENRVICLVSMLVSCLMVYELCKIVHFFQLCADLQKEPKYVKIIYIYLSESSHYTHLENDMVCRGLSHHSLDILAVRISKKMLTQQKFNKIFWLQTLISLKQ